MSEGAEEATKGVWGAKERSAPPAAPARLPACLGALCGRVAVRCASVWLPCLPTCLVLPRHAEHRARGVVMSQTT